MLPSEYSVRLQKGIVGFGPPIPDHIYTVKRLKDELEITSEVRLDGAPKPKEVMRKYIKHDDHAEYLDEIYGILKSPLPTEKPPGSQDIYGMNTSIEWRSDDLQWQNGGPDGCEQGTSEEQPSDKEKEKFKRAVKIVNWLVNDANGQRRL
ncbi:hypothetical protein V5O48_016279 [Marasmius crinis-equi]|uniref:Uncharacterized protein n=1 Tax=Marasmius crinis-equi TaxID=585013 RepID=A0ABR3ES50_9AGAR